MTNEEIQQLLTKAGLSAQNATELASKIAPAAPAPNEAEYRRLKAEAAREKLRALPVSSGYAPDADRVKQAHEREKLMKEILENSDHPPILGGAA